jgi:hypothetical protein
VRTAVEVQLWEDDPETAAVVHAAGKATGTTRKSTPDASVVAGAPRVRVYGAGTVPVFVSVTTLVVDSALDV